MMVAGVALFMIVAGHAAPVDADLPAAIAGTWDVETVAVDAEDQQHWEVKPDDPTLMGRTLVIETAGTQFDDGKEVGCKPLSLYRWSTTWGFLVAKGFPRPPMGGRSRSPTPGDFGLKMAKSQKVAAYSLCSASTGRKSAHFPGDAWVAVESPDRLALHYDNQVLLLLRRRAADAKPSPSFDCGKATSPTERAICTSFDLASWDRSVALAFRRALEGKPPARQELLKRAQHEWLRTRDACGAKTECLDERLWRRVDDLNQD